MIDKEKIHESTYNELVDLMGKEKAEVFIEGSFYNHQAISRKILMIKFGRFIKRRPVLFVLLLAIAILMIVMYYL